MPIVRENTEAGLSRARPLLHKTRDAAIEEARSTRVESAPLVWREPTNLDAPEPRPGWVQRWVRDLVNADARDANFSRRFSEGWRPRDPNTVSASYQYMIGNTSGGHSVIRVGNSILCEMPIELAQQRAAHYRGKLETQMRTAGLEDMSAVAAAGRKIGMRPIDSQVEEIIPSRGRTPSVMTD